MILVIDVSNTNMVFGVFEGKMLKASWRLSTQSGRTSDETGLMIRGFRGRGESGRGFFCCAERDVFYAERDTEIFENGTDDCARRHENRHQSAHGKS